MNAPLNPYPEPVNKSTSQLSFLRQKGDIAFVWSLIVCYFSYEIFTRNLTKKCHLNSLRREYTSLNIATYVQFT
jgi:hypothetical protein